MGHSRLAQARLTFYKAVSDYKKLTGKDRPENFDFEELPELEDSEGSVELVDDDDAFPTGAPPSTDSAKDASTSSSSNAPSSSAVLVPNEKPTCLAGCKIIGA